MVALHRGRLECAKALLRAGADPNFVNNGGDLTMFWAIDGGVELIKLCKVHCRLSWSVKATCMWDAATIYILGCMLGMPALLSAIGLP